jgi:hypothetical protein
MFDDAKAARVARSTESAVIGRLSLGDRRVRDTAGKISTPKPSYEEWDLHQYIEVAADLGLIEPADTLPQLRLAKDFRNLIHPGRSIRLARACDRPTALAAVAGLGFLIRDLTP